MTANQLPLFLRILKDGKLLDVKQFTGHTIVIGREGKVDALVNDMSLSPIHAMIEEREDGKFYICDLGSQSGTFVKGEKVVDHALESGDEFKLGDVTIEFYIGVPRKKGGEPTTQVSSLTANGIPKSIPKDPPKETPRDTPKEPVKEPAKETRAAAPKETPKEKEAPKKKDKDSAFVPGGLATLGATMHRTPAASRGPVKGTFAPPSSAKIQENLKPGKGNVVEVVMVWKDRILNTYHFDKPGVVQIGSHPQNNIILPSFGSVRVSHPLVKMENGMTTVYLTQDMTGELLRDGTTTTVDEMRRKGTIMPSGAGYSYAIQQNEVMKVNIGEGVVLIIRFVGSGPDSRLIPFIDMSVNTLTGLVVGLMATALFLFYVYLYSPPPPEPQEPEPERKAIIIMPRAPEVPVKLETTPEPEPKAAAKTEEKKAPTAPARGAEGGAKNPKPRKDTKAEVSKTKGTTEKGPPKAASKPVPKPKDVSKSGLLGAFGSSGMQSEVNRAHGASQGATNNAENATGTAPDGTEDGGGNSLHQVNASGNGTATYGIKGVETAGKGSGRSGYGQSGIGAKKNASLIAGDEPSIVSGSIDKEAIRRVVQANLRQIKACYEKGLNREPGLYGKIVIQWTIGPGGHVLEAGIKSTTMNSSEVENCSVARLRTWKFPEPPAGEVAVVSYPFVFQAQE